ncbi:hypothetical protein EsH8_IV_000357 [Colletotrichum jinshuiense]
MSTIMTASQRLALSKWAQSQDNTTPTIPRAAEWVKEQFGKDIPEDTIRTVLNRADLANDFHAYDDGELGPLIRPGFGMVVNAMPENMFPSAVVDWQASTLTWAEAAILWFIDQITNKPDWHVKVFNNEIVSKWKAEVLAVDWPAVGLQFAYFDDDMFEFSLGELRDKAELFKATGLIPVFDASAAVIKSDNAIPPEVKAELKRGVAPLEDVPEHEKDWHPGSDGKVLDLVHPSLWPLVYGVSRIVADKRVPLKDIVNACGTGKVIPEPGMDTGDMPAWTNLWRYDYPYVQRLWSTKFQWLPCDVEIEDGKPNIVSYINNLHPQHHAGLYATIEKVIEKALPMWDVVYRWPEEFETTRIACHKAGKDCQTKETCGGGGYCRPENRPLDPDEDERDEDEYNENWEDDDDEPEREVWRRDKIWFKETHPVLRPEVPKYTPMNLQPKHVNMKSGFFGDAERIQVIVKLANIHLTPEKPTYDGGSWHIEGQLNEHICATALYYYDNDNVTDSHLAFRTTANRGGFSEDLQYEQSDHHSIERTFRIDSTGDTSQELGSVLTREDRLLAFPNVYQHCVAPFELADKTKPGHRKILALFLVDPAIPIISTANVPPQQRDWWRSGVTPDNRIGPLPPEVTEMVLDNLDFPIGIEEAKRVREELMKERTALDQDSMRNIGRHQWSFCEH